MPDVAAIATKQAQKVHWKIAVERISGVKSRRAAELRAIPNNNAHQPHVITSEILMLRRAVQLYLDGSKPNPRCGSMIAVVTADGYLDIRFNADGSLVDGRHSDGRLVIDRRGDTQALELP